jgi:hypothetical protein
MGIAGLATERSRALGRKVTAQELLAEALNDLFKKYGKPEVARGYGGSMANHETLRLNVRNRRAVPARLCKIVRERQKGLVIH